MSNIRTVLCPHCNNSHNVKGRSNSVQRHFAVERNSSGLMEFQLELLTGQSIQEWMYPDDSIQARMIMAGFIGCCVMAPYAMIGQVASMPDQPLIISSFAVFSLSTALVGTFLEYLRGERVKAARWIKSQYMEADKPSEIPIGDTLKLEVQEKRVESQSEMYAYKLLGNLSVDINSFKEWAFQVSVNGRSLAYSHWTGAGKLFSRGSYGQLLDHMKEGGIAQKGHDGWALTYSGIRTLKRVAN